MLEHPVTLITGYGWNAYESSRHFRYATHSVYVSYLYDIGLIGLSLFVAVAINVIRAARGALTTATEMLRPYFVSLVFGFISLLIAAAFVNLYKVWFFIWAFSGAVLRLAILEAVRADVRR